MARAAQVLRGNGASVYFRPTDSSGVGVGVFVRIPSAITITLPADDREEVDATDLDSPGDAKEFLLGDTDPGESTLTVHFNPQNVVHQQLDSASSDELYEWKFQLADGHCLTWRGRIKSRPYEEVARNVALKRSFTIRNSGLADPWTD